MNFEHQKRDSPKQNFILIVYFELWTENYAQPACLCLLNGLLLLADRLSVVWFKNALVNPSATLICTTGANMDDPGVSTVEIFGE